MIIVFAYRPPMITSVSRQMRHPPLSKDGAIVARSRITAVA